MLILQRPEPSCEPDDVVIVHEMAHAAIWLREGGAVGRLFLERHPPQCLGGKYLSAPRPEMDIASDRFLRSTAVRALAGESAARRALGLERRGIWSSTAAFVTGSAVLGCDPCPDEKDRDISTALVAAMRAGGSHWEQWLEESLEIAISAVDESWHEITKAASALSDRVPASVGTRECVYGFEILELLQELSPTRAEVLLSDEPVGNSVRARREATLGRISGTSFVLESDRRAAIQRRLSWTDAP